MHFQPMRECYVQTWEIFGEHDKVSALMEVAILWGDSHQHETNLNPIVVIVTTEKQSQIYKWMGGLILKPEFI